MRVLIVTGRFSRGGIENVVTLITQELIRLGHVVGLAATDIDPHSRSTLNPTVWLWTMAPRALSYPLSLISAVRRFRPDSILTTASDVSAAVLILRMLAFANVRVVVSQHQPISSLPRGRGVLRRIRHWVTLQLCKVLYPRADKVIAVSSGARAELTDRFGVDIDKSVVIGNPIITPDFALRSSDEVEWPWADMHVPTIIYVGRAAPEKRLDLIAAAFQALSAEAPLRLLLVGPEMEDLVVSAELAASGNIQAIGFRPNPLPYIAASDVLVLCSDFEGFGNVLVEAMGCGTQVVATDCPFGPREILGSGRYGQLVPTDDPEAIAHAVRRALAPGGHVRREDLMQRASHFGAALSTSAYVRELT